jgi:hypothetical protein
MSTYQEEPMSKVRVRLARRSPRGIALVLGTAITVTALSGVAYAFWTVSGSGSGNATVGSAAALTVSVPDVTGVYPKQKTTAPVTVTNTNVFPVTLSTITLDSVVATGSGCANTDVSLDSTASGVSGATYTVSVSLTKAGSGATASSVINLPIAIADLVNACQGAGHSFALTVTAHGQSS